MCSLSNVSFQLPEIHKTDDYKHLYKVTKKSQSQIGLRTSRLGDFKRKSSGGSKASVVKLMHWRPSSELSETVCASSQTSK